MSYTKYLKDGEVAVLVSPGFGAGWSTWCEHETAKAVLFDSELVELLLADKRDDAASLATSKYPKMCMGGFADVEVMWVPEGQTFEIDEYYGSESLNIIGNQTYLVA